MQLLVSVADAADASAAIAGGADWIDAKDPIAGPLGRVTPPALESIRAAVAGERPISAALGDIDDEATAERIAAQYSRSGIALVKIGLGRAQTTEQLTRRAAAAVHGAAASVGNTRVVAVAYADEGIWGPQPAAFAEAVGRAGVDGVLLDTAQKDGPGLCRLLSPALLAGWVEAARRSRLLIAMAGRLAAPDLLQLSDLDPDVAGVRGAACEGGRTGRIVAAKVIALRSACVRPGQPVSRPA
jgi:(5-formylfuran-3-yl)methyl phosphate synthase